MARLRTWKTGWAGALVLILQFPLPDSSYVSAPVLNWLRAGDRRIESIGVEPDMWLLPALEDIRAGRELSKPASTS